MIPNIDVFFKDIDQSPALTSTIHKKFRKLSKYSGNIIHSKVVVDSPNKSKIKGKVFRASIELGLKGKPVLVSHDDSSAHIAVRDAFSAAERKLKELSKQAKH